MVSKTALSRTPAHTKIDSVQNIAPLASDVAHKIAMAWHDIISAEDMLMDMGRTAIPMQIVPAAQNAAASILADIMPNDARVYCAGFQSYGWMTAAGMSLTDIARLHLGKILIQNVMPMSAEDTAVAIKKGPVSIVALHVEAPSDWASVRAISAAAVKTGAPMLMVVSTAIPAPEGVAIDVMTHWEQAAHTLRAAMDVVENQGAIRVLAIDDMTSSAVERAMMAAANINIDAWIEAAQKNNDGADIAMNTAYQAPVESF